MPHHRLKPNNKPNPHFKVKHTKNKIYTSVKLQSITRCMQKSVDNINQSVLSFAKLPNKTKSPEMKRIMSDIDSQQKDIHEYKHLLQREIAPILSEYSSHYIYSRIINSNTTPSSMNSCIVSPDSLKTSTKALPTRISKVTKATFDEDDIPLPANRFEYTPFEVIKMISSYKGVNKTLIKQIIKEKYVPVKEATIHRIMRKYKQFGTYNAEWHRKGR